VLYAFGDNVYDLFKDHGESKGPHLFMLFYIIVGVFASIVHIVLTAFNPMTAAIPVIGASGAVSGVLAAYWRAFPKTRIYQILFWYPFKIPIWLYVSFWIQTNIIIGLAAGSGARVSWQAHIGGFIAGYFLIPHFLPFRLERLQRKEKASIGM
jgi:membrane associated rhomboid family serine protease